MTWMTSSRTTLYGVYSWTVHSKLQFILVETIWWIYDLPRINSWSLWNSYSKWLKSWSRIRQKSVVWPRLITKNLRGDRRLYYVTKRLRSRMPKPTSSPTPCSVWEVWVTDQSKPGRTKLNGVGKLVSQRFESNRRRADGVQVENIHRIHHVEHSRRHSKIMTELLCEPVQFKGIFMPMYNDNVWRERGNTENVKRIL